MKKALILVSVFALAASAFAFEVMYYQGRPVYHTKAQMPWTMRFNSLGTPDCSNEFARLVSALDTWSNVTYQWYRNSRGSNSSILETKYDNVNLCVWYEPTHSGQGSWPFSASAIAVNQFWMADEVTYWRVIENDVSFNGYNYTWSDSGASGQMDVQNIATHEFGHNLVLADLYSPGDSEKTMYGYASPGETRKRTLHSDDINGIRYLYPNAAVTLESFTARVREGEVMVEWKAAVEEDHAGYNLYRMEDAAGADYVKVNGALITGSSPYSFSDEGVRLGADYKYLLEAVDLTGHKQQFGPVRVTMPSGTKAAFALASAYPNPAHSEATISFSLADGAEGRLDVYDLSGRRVKTLFTGGGAGEHEVVWNLADESGRAVPPGVYIYRLEAGNEASARRLVIAR